MSLLVDSEFVYQVSYRLRNFKKKTDYLWNFSCPICGDSQTNKTKARGYFLRDRQKDRITFKCHNCGAWQTFKEFLKEIDADLYKQYVYQSFLETTGRSPKTIDNKSKEIEEKSLKQKLSIKRRSMPEVFASFASIASLSDDHLAKQYILQRKIPLEFHSQLFYTDDFASAAYLINPKSEEQNLKKKEPRIIIPLLDRNWELIGIQGRGLEKSSLIRYITIKAHEDVQKIYGLHRLSKIAKRVYMFEGPFDSMFIPESIAMVGSDIPSSIPRDKSIVVYDNEPSSPVICKKIEKAIQNGYRVTIWPTCIDQTRLLEKDINEMVLSGYTPKKIREVIDTNSFVGREATYRLLHWKKC